MKRIDYIKAQRLSSGPWVLDIHSALYVAMNRKTLTTVPYTITQAHRHRLDLVALKVYGDDSMWWVLAQYNGMINVMAETVTGRVIQVPMHDEVMNLLNQSAVQSSRVGQQLEV